MTGEIVIKLSSSDFPSIDAEAVEVPLTTGPEELKTLVEGLNAKLDEGVELDFLLRDQLIRTSLAKHLEENEIETDVKLDILVLKKQDAPVPENSYTAEDWISDIACRGDQVLLASYDGTVALWDADEDEVLFSVNCSRNVEQSEPIKCVTWVDTHTEKEDSIFAAGSMDGDIAIFRWENDRTKKAVPMYSLRGHHGSVETVACLSDRVLVSGGQDKNVRVWKDIAELPQGWEELSAKKRAKREERGEVKTSDVYLEGHSESISCSTVLSKEEFATGGMDNTLRIWDLNKMSESNTLQGVKAFFDIDYSQHSKLIASGSSDRHVRLWDPRTTTGKVSAQSLTSHTLWISTVRWNPSDRNQLLSGSYDNVVKMWDIRSTKTPLYDMQKHEDKVLCSDWSRSKLVVSGGSDKQIHSYRVK